MRFVIIGPTYPFRGGIAQHTTRLYNTLSFRHSVELLTFQRQYPKWIFPGKTDKDPSAPPPNSVALPMLDPLNPITWIKTALHIRDLQPDALIVPWWEPFWGLSFASITFLVRRYGVRVIFVCHNVIPHESRPGAILMSHLVFKQGDGFVIQSLDDGARIAQWIPRARVRYVPHPIYGREGSPGSIAHQERNATPQLLFFGFVRPYKGLRVLLNAISIITRQRKVQLTIAGEFWEKRQGYEQLIHALGIESSVNLIDRYLSDQELDALFAQSDLVILPYLSTTTSAALGVTIGHGVPVVVSNVGDLGKIVSENIVGEVAVCGDAHDLAQKILKCLDPELLRSYRRNVAKLQTNAEGSWQSLVDAIEVLTNP